MSLTLTLGTADPIDLLNLSDLQTTASTVFKTLDEFKPWLDGAISAVPASLSSSVLNYSSGDQTWQPSSGPLTFTLSGSVVGSITVLQSVAGSPSLLTYTTGFPVLIGDGLATTDNSSNNTWTINPQGGKSYIKLSLQFTLSASAGLTYTSGIYGANVQGGANSTVLVEFFKAVDSATSLKSAISQAFTDFTLPLHAATLKSLKTGDLVHYSFNATLQVSVGASISPPNFTYAAKDSYTLNGALANVAGVSGAINPVVSSGVKATFSCDYSGAFEAVIQRPADNTAIFHLYRSTQVQTGIDVNATLTASANATGVITASPQAALNAATSALATAVPILAPILQDVTLPATWSGALTNWVTEINTKVASWLGKANNLGSQIDASVHTNSQKFILAEYTIDLTQAYNTAWDAMIHGRFYDALSTANSGITLATGNGLESFYNRTAKFSLNLFGDFSANWSSAYIQNSSLTYAGNNVFHLTTRVGDQLLTNIGNLKQEIDLYFAADLDLTNVAKPIDPADFKLHILLQGTNNKALGANLATILGDLATGPSGVQLYQAMSSLASQSGATVSLHLIFSANAFANITYSQSFVSPGDQADRWNYASYQLACNQLYQSSPQNFTDINGNPIAYNFWSNCNYASNDQWPVPDGNTPTPNRRATGGANPSLASALQSLTGSDLFLSTPLANSYYEALDSAAQFMNLCEDLHHLAIPTTQSAASWNNVVKELTQIVKNDVNADYISAVGLALTKVCKTSFTTISGPVVSLPAGTSLGVTLTF
jgi:hypothetical protein